jgi:hypothetical protein
MIFVKNFLAAIPLAIGVVFTIFSVVNALDASGDIERGITALLCGLVGIPLLFASVVTLSRRPPA